MKQHRDGALVTYSWLRIRLRTLEKRPWGRLLWCQQGVGLAETLVATAIMSLAIVAMLSAFSTGAAALRKTDFKVTAENLARNQMEFTKSQPYQDAPTTYPVINPLPPGYTVMAQAEPVSGRDNRLQKVTVVVQLTSNTLFTLEDFKLNR